MEKREHTAADAPGVVRGMARWEIRDRAQHAQRSIVTATLACLAGSGQPAAEPTLVLQHAVEDYAHILAALGHDARSTGELARQAVRDAPKDGAPASAALLDTVRRWAEEAARESGSSRSALP